MNQFKLCSVILMATFSFISCQKTALDSTSTLQQETTSKASNAATVLKQITEIDLSGPTWNEYNACNGNYVKVIQGIWRIEQTITFNGNIAMGQFHTNTSNYKLMDLTTGIAYTGSYVSNDTYSFDLIYGQPAQVTGTLKILLTTPGKDNNGVYMVDYHATITPNGVITVDFVNQRAECQ